MLPRSLPWRLALACGLLTAAASLAFGLLLIQETRDHLALSRSVASAALPTSDLAFLNSAHVLAMITASLLCLAVAGIAFRLASTTTASLAELTAFARRMAEGDLSQPVRLSASVEVEELAEVLGKAATRLRNALVSLSSERNTMQAMLESMEDGILLTDRHGTVMLVNRAAGRMLRIAQGRAIGRSFMGVVLDHELRDLLARCLESDEQQTAQIETGPGKRVLQVVATPVEVEGGPLGLVVLHDLTDVRRAEQVRREFVGNVSHELRTPLASLKLLVETLQEGAIHDDEAAQGFLERMQIEVDGMAQLVHELLELSRIESGHLPLAREPVALGAVIARAVDRLRPQAERAGLQIEVSVPEELPLVLVDQERVGQVLLNLLHNAIKFTPPPGKISVAAEQRNAEVAVQVADTGEGIPPDDLERIFVRFYKADKARSSGGTGLGLAIAKHLVQAHGGNIWAENRPGRGAVFTFTLPVHPACQQQGLAPPAAS